MEMYKEFPDWYRKASVQVDSELLKNRWPGVVEAANEFEGVAALDVVRLFYGKKPKASSFLETFKKCFRNHDETFGTEPNETELKVLAGSAVATALISEESEIKDHLTLAMICGAAWMDPPPDPLIMSHAEEHLSKEGAAQRRRPKIQSIPIPRPITQEKIELIKANVPENLPPVLESLKASIQSVATAATENAEALKEVIQAQDEELNTFWWVFNGVMRFNERPFAEAKPGEAALVSGGDLADLNKFTLGRSNFEAFLRRVLIGTKDSSKNVTLQNAVNQTSDDWKRSRLSDTDVKSAVSDLGELCPISLALSLSHDAGGSSQWTKAFANLSGLSASTKSSPVILARQYFLESLLIDLVVGA